MAKQTLLILDDLLQTLGVDGCLQIVETYAGTRLFVPNAPNGQIDGLPDADAARLIERYRGDVLRIPLAREWRFKVYREQGLSYAKIARRLGCTESNVEKIALRLRAAANENKASVRRIGFTR